MLSNPFSEKFSKKILSLLNDKDLNTNSNQINNDFILVNGKPISIKNNSIDINITFPEFNSKDKIESEAIYNTQRNSDSSMNELNRLNSFNNIQLDLNSNLHKLSQNTNKNSFINKNNFDSKANIRLINNGIFAIFYIVFAFSFLIFLFLYENHSIKSKENYIQIGNFDYFFLDFFKMQNISKFIFETFTFYTSLFGILIVYIAFAKISEKNIILPYRLKFSKSYLYSIFIFGFFSNFMKLTSGFIVLFNFNKSYNRSLGDPYKISLYEIIFNFEIYFTLAYGFLLCNFLKYFSDFKEKNTCYQKNLNEETYNRIDNESLLQISKNENLINNSNDNMKIDSNNILDDRLCLNIFHANENEKQDSKWLKFKIISLVYLFFMLLILHTLKVGEQSFIDKKYFQDRSNQHLKKKTSYYNVNFNFIYALLPYCIYIGNSIFFFLNYGLLKCSQFKLI